MGNHTVNKKTMKHVVETTEGEKEITVIAAGKNDKTKTTAVAWVNNRPQELEIEVINSKETKNLPFMIENGDLVANTDVAVVIKAEDNREVEHDRD